MLNWPAEATIHVLLCSFGSLRYWELCNRPSKAGRDILARTANLYAATAPAPTVGSSTAAAILDTCVAEAITAVLQEAAEGTGTGVALEELRLSILAFGIAALHAFVQANFVGPKFRDGGDGGVNDDSKSPLRLYMKSVQDHFQATHRNAVLQTATSVDTAEDAASKHHHSLYDHPAEPTTTSRGSSQRRPRTDSVWMNYLNVDGESVYVRNHQRA